ncbi:MAG: hypothetical protein HY319_31860 [Armatimonadetes bacterium]|nr:hypothetical protein [Armatimonadota bacterium]
MPEDTNGKSDIYVRDLQAGTVELASRGLAGVPGNGGSSARCSPQTAAAWPSPLPPAT